MSENMFAEKSFPAEQQQKTFNGKVELSGF